MASARSPHGVVLGSVRQTHPHVRIGSARSVVHIQTQDLGKSMTLADCSEPQSRKQPAAHSTRHTLRAAGPSTCFEPSPKMSGITTAACAKRGRS